MLSKKAPTFLFSAIGLFVEQAWARCRVRFQRASSGDVPRDPDVPSETPISMTPSPPVTRLPQEVIEMIVAYFTYDVPGLLACSLTCYSWYIAAAPHLPSPVLSVIVHRKNQKLKWSRSERILSLGPFVKNVAIRSEHPSGVFSPRPLDSQILSQFSALTNVQGVQLEALDIPRFMQTTEASLDRFLPRVRSLALGAPKGSRREIIFFIGLFQNLENLFLHNSVLGSLEREPEDDLSLIPPFAPPLRGALTIWRFNRAGLLKDMVSLFGGIKFYHVELFDVDETQFLLRACADTLQMLRIHLTDPRVQSCPQTLDLSQNKFLQSLEVTASSIDSVSMDGSLVTASSLLQRALAGVRSPRFSRVVIIYRESDFRGIRIKPGSKYPRLREVSLAEREEEASRHCRHFEILREVRKIRRFSLELNAMVWKPMGMYCLQVLEEAVSTEAASNGFDEVFPMPGVTLLPFTDLRLVHRASSP